MNQDQLENCTYDQNVSHLKIELELNSLETPDKVQINTVIQHSIKQDLEKRKPKCHHCTKPGHSRTHCLAKNIAKREKILAKGNKNSADDKNTNNIGQTTFNPHNKDTSISNANKATTEMTQI